MVDVVRPVLLGAQLDHPVLVIEHCRQAWANSIDALRALAGLWNGRNGRMADRLRREANGMAQAMDDRDDELASIAQTIEARQNTIKGLQGQMDEQREAIAELQARYLRIQEGREHDRLGGHPRGPRGYDMEVSS